MLIQINGPNQDLTVSPPALEANYYTFSTAIVGQLVLKTPRILLPRQSHRLDRAAPAELFSDRRRMGAIAAAESGPRCYGPGRRGRADFSRLAMSRKMSRVWTLKLS
jgi:hypothetical protein